MKRTRTNILKKTVAFFLAILLIFGMSPIAVNAVSVDVSSDLSYDMSVEKIDDTNIVLHVDFSNRFTLTQLDFKLYYDETCSIRGEDIDAPEISAASVDNENHVLFLTILFVNGKKSDFSIDFYFTTDSSDLTHTFSASVTRYSSSSGDYSAQNEKDVSFATGDLYTIGDVNCDGFVDPTDSSCIYAMLDSMNTTSITVEYANQNVTALRKVDGCAKFVCGEAADVNDDMIIDAMDATEIMTYYVNMQLGSPSSNDIIGTKYYVIIVL